MFCAIKILEVDSCHHDSTSFPFQQFGFTREQSGNALIIHGTVEKAFEVLSSVNQPGVFVIHSPRRFPLPFHCVEYTFWNLCLCLVDIQDGAVPTAQAVNVSGVSPLLSSSADLSPELHAAPTTQCKNKPSALLQTTNDQQSVPHQAHENTRTPQWVHVQAAGFYRWGGICC